jgi:hypothetical protein
MGKYITLTAPVEVANNVPRIVKFRAVGATDYDEESPPYLIVKVQAYGAGAGDVNPYGPVHTLRRGVSAVFHRQGPGLRGWSWRRQPLRPCAYTVHSRRQFPVVCLENQGDPATNGRPG